MILVGAAGLEPAKDIATRFTDGPRCRLSTLPFWERGMKDGLGGRIRTCDNSAPNGGLYQTELHLVNA